MKNCPYCAEKILDAAILCKHCGKALTDSPARVVTRPPVQPEKKGNPVGLLLILIGLGIAGTVAFNFLPLTTSGVNVSSSPVQVKYFVSGRPTWPGQRGYYPKASVTYSAPGGSTQQADSVELPWTYTSSAFRDGEFLYMSAQNKNSDGCVKVEIFRNSSLYKTAESCGEYVIASATGSR